MTNSPIVIVKEPENLPMRFVYTFKAQCLNPTLGQQAAEKNIGDWISENINTVEMSVSNSMYLLQLLFPVLLTTDGIDQIAAIVRDKLRARGIKVGQVELVHAEEIPLLDEAQAHENEDISTPPDQLLQ